MAGADAMGLGPAATPTDRFSRGWPVYCALVGFAATVAAIGLSVMRAFYVYDEGYAFAALLPPFFGLLVLSGAGWVIAGAFAIRDGRWRRLASIGIAPFFGIVVPYIYYLSGISPRFLVERPRFERVVSALLENGGKRYREFEWDETGGAGLTNTVQIMVFDESDTLPRLIKDDKTKWPYRYTSVTTMGDHFYLVNELLDRG